MNWPKLVLAWVAFTGIAVAIVTIMPGQQPWFITLPMGAVAGWAAVAVSREEPA